MVKSSKSQMKIQQMAFMIVALLLFFVIAGLFFLSYSTSSLKDDAALLKEEQAVTSLKVIATMPELVCEGSYSGLCIDEDKAQVMANQDYSGFWPVSSIKIYSVYPDFYNISVYSSNQKSNKMYSTYTTLCKKTKEAGYRYQCSLAKLLVGVKE